MSVQQLLQNEHTYQYDAGKEIAQAPLSFSSPNYNPYSPSVTIVITLCYIISNNIIYLYLFEIYVS